MENKYEFTDEVINTPSGRVLHRIRALRDFGNVEKGDLGGFIEWKSNLSHEGNCWVYGDSKVFGAAKVSGNAHVENSSIYDAAKISGDAFVTSSVIFGESMVYNNAYIEDSIIYGSCKICNRAHVIKSNISDEAKILGRTCVKDSSVYEKARVDGWFGILNLRLGGNSTVNSKDDYIAIDGGNYDITFARTTDNNIFVSYFGYSDIIRFEGNLYNEFIDLINSPRISDKKVKTELLKLMELVKIRFNHS